MNPAIVTIKTRYPTVKIIFTLDTVQMMRKYQMTPDLLRRLIRLAAGEGIDPDIVTFFRQNKFDPIGEPGVLNPQPAFYSKSSGVRSNLTNPVKSVADVSEVHFYTVKDTQNYTASGIMSASLIISKIYRLTAETGLNAR